MIQHGVSAGGIDNGSSREGVTIGRVMDWTEARLEALKQKDEEEDEDEDRDKDRERGKPSTAPAAPASAPSAPKVSKSVPQNIPNNNARPKNMVSCALFTNHNSFHLFQSRHLRSFLLKAHVSHLGTKFTSDPYIHTSHPTIATLHEAKTINKR